MITSLTSWWLAQQAPVPGLLRLVFYAGLLALCLADHPSPLDAPRLIARTDRRFYTPPAVLRWLGLGWISVRALRAIRAATIVFWVAAALGLAQPIAGVLTFAGFALLHAVNSGALGSNHSTHSALYALFCMCFSVSYDGPTLDRVLADSTSWPLLAGPGSVFQSSFAPTLLLVMLAYVMFAGGVSKLRLGGRAWLNGRALHYYIAQSADVARAPAVSRAVLARPRLCAALAVSSVVIELAAPLALLSPTLRLPFVLAWSALHVGILLVMMPAYWVQMWCYVLVLDWYRIAGAVIGQPVPVPAAPDLGGAGAVTLAVLGTAAGLLLVAVLIRGIEQWPFTSVPMYSNGVPPGALVLPARDTLHDRAVRAARGRHAAWQRPWVSTEALEDVRLVPSDGRDPVPLFDVLADQDIRFVRWSQYAKVVRAVAIADIAAKPAGRPDATGPQYPAARFLHDVADLVRSGLPDWRSYQHVELVCHTATGWMVTGRGDLHPGDRRSASPDPG